MPVTKSRNGMHDILSLDPSNTTRFLFGEDDAATSPDVKNYLQMNTTDDKFPILVRRDEYPGLVSPDKFLDSSVVDRQMQLSASSAALDLALSQSPGPEALSSNGGWGAFTRHRSSQSQQSLPLSVSQGPSNGSVSTAHSNDPISPISVRPSYRHSLDLKYYDSPQEPTSQISSPPKMAQATPPKLQSSYSANDVPTMRTSTNGISSVATTPNSHAQQHLHNHNASLGRIPPTAMNRLSREMASPETATLREAQNGGYQSIQSALQANAAPFGPSLSQSMSQAPIQAPMVSPTSQQYPTPVPGYYNNYNMQMMSMNMGMQNMALNQPMYPAPNQYGGYGGQMYSPQGQPRDSQARVIQQRRQNDGEGEFFGVQISGVATF
jgi:hypothetical protein